MTAEKDYYKVLGVARDASPTVIKRAYRQLIRSVHPDMGEDADEAKTIEYNHAWEILGDPERRRAYDATGRDESQGPTIEEAGQAALMSIFDAELNRGATDIINRVRLNLLGKMKELNSDLIQMTQSKRVMDKAKTRIRRKSKGSNVYYQLMVKRVETVDEGIKAAKERLKDAELALKLLDDYYDSAEEDAPKARVAFNGNRLFLGDR